MELSLHFFGGIAAQRARFVRIIDRARRAFLAARDRSVRAESVQFFKQAIEQTAKDKTEARYGLNFESKLFGYLKALGKR